MHSSVTDNTHRCSSIQIARCAKPTRLLRSCSFGIPRRLKLRTPEACRIREFLRTLPVNARALTFETQPGRGQKNYASSHLALILKPPRHRYATIDGRSPSSNLLNAFRHSLHITVEK
eukprot:IDg19372t1